MSDTRPQGVDAATVVILAGPPGAGKSTVASRLADEFDQCVVIGGDSFFDSVRSGWIPPWEPGADAQNEAVIRAIGSAASRYAEAGYVTIVDGMIGPWFLPVLLSEIDGPARYVVLRPSAEAAFARAVAREAPELTDTEPIVRMYEAYADLGEYEAEAIDSTDLTIDETVAAVLELV